jgi:nitrogen regulatory protein A
VFSLVREFPYRKEEKVLGTLQAEIDLHLAQLRSLTSCDFAALAWTDETTHMIRWKYASGNRNDRYKRIILRPGRGIAGQVTVTGRPMIMDSFSIRNGDDPREFPILLAEGLKSVLAAPVVINGKVLGVLLIGCRYARVYQPYVLELVMNVAEQLGSMIQQREQSSHDVILPFPHKDGNISS